MIHRSIHLTYYVALIGMLLFSLCLNLFQVEQIKNYKQDIEAHQLLISYLYVKEYLLEKELSKQLFKPNLKPKVYDSFTGE